MLDCSHFVSNDSGLMNIANALGIPTLALFAPTNDKTRLPLGPAEPGDRAGQGLRALRAEGPGRLRHGAVPLHGGHHVDEVEARLLAMMRRSPPHWPPA